MNDIVIILIIIGVIISFLSKIFRQQKKAETEQTPAPVAKPKPVEWLPSWFEETENEQEFPEFKEEKLVFDTVTATKEKPPVIEQKKYEPREKVPIRETVTESHKAETLAAFNISLESPDDLKQGIVLAEILGPCKANKKQRRFL